MPRSIASTPVPASLYYLVTDHNPGDATGQDVVNFGAGWDVIGPDGNKVDS